MKPSQVTAGQYNLQPRVGTSLNQSQMDLTMPNLAPGHASTFVGMAIQVQELQTWIPRLWRRSSLRLSVGNKASQSKIPGPV